MGTKIVREYEKITAENCLKSDHVSNGFDSERSFDVLKNFLADERTGKIYDSILDYGRKNGREYIKVKNYVGVISLNTGDTLEILPKIKNDSGNDNELKALVLKMVQAVPEVHNLKTRVSSVGVGKLPLFEVFIRMFVDEVFSVIKVGIKCGYDNVEENLNYYKPKVLFSKNIKYNYVHLERSFSIHDVYNANRVENRLIKTTLLFLYQKTKSTENKRDINFLLDLFEDVSISKNYDVDFSKCSKDRNIMYYQTALSWCEVFLHGKSFTPFSGSGVACVILFPMEKLFESYIAKEMRHICNKKGYRFKAQDSGFYLYSSPEKIGALRPDMVIENKEKGEIYIIDTKWKLPDEKKISKADLAQMYSYQKKYSSMFSAKRIICKNATLLYPELDRSRWYCDSLDDAALYVTKVELMGCKIGEQLSSILEQVENPIR